MTGDSYEVGAVCAPLRRRQSVLFAAVGVRTVSRSTAGSAPTASKTPEELALLRVERLGA
jgi:hypothetical protein